MEELIIIAITAAFYAASSFRTETIVQRGQRIIELLELLANFEEKIL